MANMLMFETNKYAIKIDNFEGPLDLLWHIRHKNKWNSRPIYRIFKSNGRNEFRYSKWIFNNGFNINLPKV